MALPTPITVTTPDGVRGAIPPTAWMEGAEQAQVLVQWDRGGETYVPSTALQPRDGGGYWLLLSPEELQRLGVDTTASSLASEDGTSGEVVIPVIAESATVSKRRVISGGVRLRKVVHQEDHTFDEPLYDEKVNVERRPMNEWVDEPPATRHEGDTMIIPVVEEVWVKRYRVTEELVVTRERVARTEPQHYTLRREEVIIEPITPPPFSNGNT